MTKYGKDVIWKAFFISVSLIFISFIIQVKQVRITLLIISLLILAFTLFFFRDPERKIIEGNKSFKSILSPADGKIVRIEKVNNFYREILQDEYYNLVSIFLSPLNVHVNRIPISGKIIYIKHIKGKFKAAFKDKSSELNERTEIAIDTGEKIILFRQVAGFLARRIVCDLKEGEEVTSGMRFGMIKFGSRVDLFIPINSEITVKIGEKVKAGVTILAKLN
ncbi:MAG: phosphatidylserine decarboxylase family protein [Ignavibacteria bacterium]|nr:phosphatidylserine decarboxylase family protein [Ignavibacteria bacterium]